MSDSPALSELTVIVSRQCLDLNLYASFLVAALADSLPPEYLVVERASSMVGRLRRAPAPVLSVSVRLGQRRFILRRAALSSPPLASIAHEVSGIVLRTESVSLDVWAAALAGALTDVAHDNAAAADALARITGLSV